MSNGPCSRENGFRVDCIKLYGDVMAENVRLKAEVERLRKAGDAMAREICILGPVDDKEKKAIAEWNAAKEGKQS